MQGFAQGHMARVGGACPHIPDSCWPVLLQRLLGQIPGRRWTSGCSVGSARRLPPSLPPSLCAPGLHMPLCPPRGPPAGRGTAAVLGTRGSGLNQRRTWKVVTWRPLSASDMMALGLRQLSSCCLRLQQAPWGGDIHSRGAPVAGTWRQREPDLPGGSETMLGWEWRAALNTSSALARPAGAPPAPVGGGRLGIGACRSVTGCVARASNYPLRAQPPHL